MPRCRATEWPSNVKCTSSTPCLSAHSPNAASAPFAPPLNRMQSLGFIKASLLVARVTCYSLPSPNPILPEKRPRRRRRDTLQRFLNLGATIEAFEVVGQRQQRLRAVLDVEQRGHCGHLERRAAEALDFEAELFQLGCASDQRVVLGHRNVDDHRN